MLDNCLVEVEPEILTADASKEACLVDDERVYACEVKPCNILVRLHSLGTTVFAP